MPCCPAPPFATRGQSSIRLAQPSPSSSRFSVPLAGSQAYGKKVESGLEGLLGGDISLGKGGVGGLQPIIKSAAAYSAGQGARGSVGNLDDARTLLSSAYKVGTKNGGAGPGMSRKEQLRKIASVTPQGAF